MKSLELVRYLPEYLEPMLELHREAQVGLGPIGINQYDEESDLRAIEQIYFNNGGEFLVGLLDGEVVAMGGFQRLSKTSAELRRMRIRKDFQDRGYGSQLLRELERLAFKSGITVLSFETAKARPLTLEFYHKHGYQETGSGFYGQVETIHYRKVLNRSNLGK
jgi:GNAT superfamily N-acetyltransferase